MFIFYCHGSQINVEDVFFLLVGPRHSILKKIYIIPVAKYKSAMNLLEERKNATHSIIWGSSSEILVKPPVFPSSLNRS